MLTFHVERGEIRTQPRAVHGTAGPQEARPLEPQKHPRSPGPRGPETPRRRIRGSQ